MLFFKVNTSAVVNTLGAIIDSDINVSDRFSYLFPTWMTAIGTLVLIGFMYWLFCVPCNWTKRLDDVSYEFALKHAPKVRSSGKKDAINRIRRLRFIGTKELPPPYPNGWYSVMESSALKMGEATSVSCLGEQFVVYRTLKNKVHVLDAYCPHLGANLGVGGRVVGDSIECPFHLWSFRGSDGKCDNVPYSNCVPAGSAVRKWISREANGSIFIWYHVDRDEIPWDIPIVKEIENEQLVYQGRNEFYVNCHIQEIPENGADMAHFNAIHKASIFAGGEDPKNNILANAGVHCWQATWKPSESPTKHMASVTIKHFVELLPKLRVFKMDVVAQQIGPSYVQLHMKSPTLGRLEILQTVTPIEPLVQKVVHRFYAHRALGPVMKIMVFAESVMFERDMTMWNHKVYRSKPQLVKEDATLKAFRNWYSQFYSENSKPFSEARDDLEW